MHSKWAKKAGIDKFIADFVNRNIDYGTSWAFTEGDNEFYVEEYESAVAKQLNFFHQKDLDNENNHKSYVKAYYLHHLLDYFRETRINIYEINFVFDQFLKEKIETETINAEGNKINFLKEIHQIFDVLRKNKDELYSDLKGEYFTN
ncbi:MAG: hypothetical protein KGD72_00785 [Candidatus Lokiarchaeota archaeon]|nr:hypothetical protein [Candidatus Lokiarchaeota archaeon]